MAMFDPQQASGAGKGGAIGTAAEPWNPAAKLAAGIPSGGAKPPGPPGAMAQPPTSVTDPLSKALQSGVGKGGASGG